MLTNRQRMAILNSLNSKRDNKSSQNSFRMKEEGIYRLRFLPDKNHTANHPSEYYRQVGMHFNQKLWDKPHVCPRVTHINYEYDENDAPIEPIYLGDDCPICKIYFALLKTGLEEDAQLASSIRPRYRFIFNVIVLSHPDIMIDGKPFKYDSDKVYVFNTAPSSVKTGGRNQVGGLDQLWDMTLSNGEFKYPDLVDYQEGILIEVKRTGTGMFNTNYTVSAPEPDDGKYISDPRPEGIWREKSFSLTDFIVDEMASSEKELLSAAKKFLGQDEEAVNKPEKRASSVPEKKYDNEKVEEEIIAFSDDELNDLLNSIEG